ncbi:MAG: hypothetical protein ACI94O_001315 [Octadecabacter sp.]|jgi:hypothetical protein
MEGVALGRYLLDRLVATQRLKRHSSHKIVRKVLSIRHLRINSFVLDTP